MCLSFQKVFAFNCSPRTVERSTAHAITEAKSKSNYILTRIFSVCVIFVSSAAVIVRLRSLMFVYSKTNGRETLVHNNELSSAVFSHSAETAASLISQEIFRLLG